VNSNEQLKAFHKALDDDKGLKSKRQIVMYIALITLALTLSAATVKEANTFLFKLDFLKPEGLMALLFMANIFCFIRYQNYSVPHEETLNEIWQKRLLSDSRIKAQSLQGEQYEGILGKIYKLLFDNPTFEPIDIKYKSKFLILRYLEVRCEHKEKDYQFTLSYNLLRKVKFNYPRLLWTEFGLRGHFMIKNRETLDLLAPKLISIAAFLSILMRDKLHIFTDLFSIVPQ
jgi:hypothetical protein